MANTKTGDPAVDTFLKGYSPQVREIAQLKLKDLNAYDVEAAMKMIEGTARSLGIEVSV